MATSKSDLFLYKIKAWSVMLIQDEWNWKQVSAPRLHLFFHSEWTSIPIPVRCEVEVSGQIQLGGSLANAAKN